jgi:hypothetical protein
MKRDLYSEVSARIVAELEAGAAPWVTFGKKPREIRFGGRSGPSGWCNGPTFQSRSSRIRGA